MVLLVLFFVFFFCLVFALVCMACSRRCFLSVWEPVVNSVCARLNLSARICCCRLVLCLVLVLGVCLRWNLKMLFGVGCLGVFLSCLACFTRLVESTHALSFDCSLIFITSADQPSLSSAFTCSSSHVMFLFSSIRRSPACLYLWMCLTACLINLSLPSLSDLNRII